MSVTAIPVSPAADANTIVTPRPALEQLPPLSLQRVQNDSSLRLDTWNSLASLVLGIRARILCDDGSIAYVDEQQTPTSDRVVKSTYHALRAGVLLDLAVYPLTGTPRRGQCYAVVSLCDRSQPVPQRPQPIAKGYVTAGAALIWPHGAWCDSAEGPGYLQAEYQSQPGAGAEAVVVGPSGKRRFIKSFTAQLVTSGVANTRVVSLIIDDGTNTVFSIPYSTGQTASLTRQYCWANFGYNIGIVGTGIYVPVPFPWPLMAGWRVRTSTALIDAGDQWSAIYACVEDLIEA